MQTLIILLLIASTSLACPPSLSPLPNAWVPTGFCASVWATGLSQPRGIIKTSKGDLLVVEAQLGRVLVLWDDNMDGKSDASERAVLATASRLNHGIEIHGDFLYASSPTTVFRWKYNPGLRHNLTQSQVVVTNIPDGGHPTRTIAFDEKGLLYISTGSAGNVDSDSRRARIVRFDISSANLPIKWSSGEMFADGLRNEVGMTFDQDGVLWGVENGVDNLNRPDLGGDIHIDNPSEEVNKFVNPGKFYGYPYCWSELRIPNYGSGPGTQWVHPQFQRASPYSDQWCKSTANVVPPVWNMGAHQAPLDMKFYYGNSFPKEYSGGAFVSLHGSWNRNPAQGYSVNFLTIKNGIPTKEDVFLRHNGSSQPWPNSVRPVGIANAQCKDGTVDTNDCLYVTSDTNGQIIKVGYYSQ